MLFAQNSSSGNSLTAQSNAYLTSLQSRIITSLFQMGSSSLNNEAVLRQTGIAQSTWSEEQNRLIAMGLLEKKAAKTMTSNMVTKTVSYSLTDRGKIVAFNLLHISRLISIPKVTEAKLSRIFELHSREYLDPSISEEELRKGVMECIEIALDGFGINLTHLVRVTVEAETDLKWHDTPTKPEQLKSVLTELFGPEGAYSIEAIIASNIRARFEAPMIKTNNLAVLISEIRNRIKDRQPKDQITSL